jgi:hypothetical protein
LGFGREGERHDEVKGVVMEKLERSGNTQQIIGNTGTSHEEGERSREGEWRGWSWEARVLNGEAPCAKIEEASKERNRSEMEKRNLWNIRLLYFKH